MIERDCKFGMGFVFFISNFKVLFFLNWRCLIYSYIYKSIEDGIIFGTVAVNKNCERKKNCDWLILLDSFSER